MDAYMSVGVLGQIENLHSLTFWVERKRKESKVGKDVH